ncbi:MAG: hypothetical protein QOE77_2395 [Blastocatellia bacterium]|nr:hypothetical protein [Blastocatellia bacterium]
MKPCNYKGCLPDVNLIPRNVALRIDSPANGGHYRIGPANYGPYPALDSGVICLITNHIRR